MGILNVTPDSFSDGGRYVDVDTAVEHCLKMVADGAEILDVGGESTRPGAAPVPAEEEKELASRYLCSNVMHDGGMSILRLIAKEKPYPDAAAERPNMEDMYLFYFGKQERT